MTDDYNRPLGADDLDTMAIEPWAFATVALLGGMRKNRNYIRILTTRDPKDLEFLKKPPGPSEVSDEDVVELLTKKVQDMRNIAGLHARQIGFMNDVFVLMLNKTKLTSFVGVHDVKLSGDVVYGYEQCFSEVDEHGRMITYLAPWHEFASFTMGDGQRYSLNKFEARVFQHEVDHGQGILCRDKEGMKDLSPAKGVKMPGRNEPCFCQSGRKFKHCCLDRCEGDYK